MPQRGTVPAGDAGTELARLRAELNVALERSSLRSVARAVGMSPTGLSKLLAGGQPYRRTLTKLRAWRSPGGAGTSSLTEEDALEILLQRIPVRRRERVRKEILSVLERGATRRIG